MYVRFFHGRILNTEYENVWGFDGPIVGPVTVNFTFGTLRMTHDDDIFELPEIGGEIVLNVYDELGSNTSTETYGDMEFFDKEDIGEYLNIETTVLTLIQFIKKYEKT